MPVTSLITAAAESSGGAGATPWVVGIVVFVVLSVLMLALLAFGGGRPHS